MSGLIRVMLVALVVAGGIGAALFGARLYRTWEVARSSEAAGAPDTALVMATENTALVVAPAVLVGLLLVVSGVIAGVVVSIVVPYAQRAIAVLDIGPLAALREGWRVLRSRPGASLLVWLLNIALTFGAGLVVTTAMLVVVAALATPLVAVWLAVQFSTPLILTVSVVYAAVAACAVIGVLLTLISVANTFFWSHWTLSYLRLRQ